MEARGSSPRTSAAPAILRVHQELCEIDTRFGQIGGNGLLAILDRAGVLAHHFSGVDNIEHAMANPPAIGRARLRGQCVQRFKGQNQRYACSWRNVLDREKKLVLDLSEPFISEEKWQAAPAGVRDADDSIQHYLRLMLNEARSRHDRGDHESAAALLRGMERPPPAFDLGSNSEYLRLRAWIQSRRGFLDGIAALDALAQSQPMTLSLVNSYVCAYRYQGLIPPRAIAAWIRRGRDFLSPTPDRSDGAALPFLGHWGYFLLRSGRPDKALHTLQDACQPSRRESAIPAAIARALADYGDAWRALGHHAAAAALLDDAHQLQAEHQLEGDLADFALTYRAKLETNSVRALELLGQAKTIQRRLGNAVGETRTLLLEARLLHNSAVTDRYKARLLELRGLRPALSQCRLLAKILDNWETWTSGAADPDGGTDLYWWL
jgi:tetratricopeptide (TPR) repeat protein